MVSDSSLDSSSLKPPVSRFELVLRPLSHTHIYRNTLRKHTHKHVLATTYTHAHAHIEGTGVNMYVVAHTPSII